MWGSGAWQPPPLGGLAAGWPQAHESIIPHIFVLPPPSPWAGYDELDKICQIWAQKKTQPGAPESEAPILRPSFRPPRAWAQGPRPPPGACESVYRYIFVLSELPAPARGRGLKQKAPA